MLWKSHQVLLGVWWLWVFELFLYLKGRKVKCLPWGLIAKARLNKPASEACVRRPCNLGSETLHLCSDLEKYAFLGISFTEPSQWNSQCLTIYSRYLIIQLLFCSILFCSVLFYSILFHSCHPVCLGILPTCMSVPLACVYKGQKRVSDSLEWWF